MVREQESAQRLAKLTGTAEIGRGDGWRCVGKSAQVTQGQPLEQAVGGVEEVGTVLAVDRVDEILNERQRSGGRLSPPAKVKTRLRP